MPWRRKWHPSVVLLPGKSHGWRSLAGYSPLGHKDSDTTATNTYTSKIYGDFQDQWKTLVFSKTRVLAHTVSWLGPLLPLQRPGPPPSLSVSHCLSPIILSVLLLQFNTLLLLVSQSCPTVRYPMHRSPPGFPVRGIL